MDYTQIKLNKNLPIADYEAEIAEKFLANSNMIVIGETGSGKTTQIPIILLKTLAKIQKMSAGKVAVTEPRRIAATSVSSYVSTLVGDELGQSVGYKIRFAEQTSDKTVIQFMTDGILLREAQLDPLLKDYSVVMVDEAHERNINSDFLIGLLIDIQKKRKEQQLIPLKIIVTSATLEKEKFEKFFQEVEGETLGIVEVPGRLFPIETRYEQHDVWNYEERAAQVVEEICESKIRQTIQGENSKENGDILIFMPGKREIEDTKFAIESLRKFPEYNLEIITINADLPIEEQNKIFIETDKRKIVIATNIAETSLTVPGVVYVIDSGLIKVMEFNPHTGLNSLITKPHAKKGLEQRKGRAGRIEPGYYYALYTENSYNARQDFPTPEILRSSLSQIILVMKDLGIDDVRNFRFIDHPDENQLNAAMTELKRLGALDPNENITEKGKTMASLPMEPRLSNLIIGANSNGVVETIATMASFLELKPVILNLSQEDIYKRMYDELIIEKTDDEGNIEEVTIAEQETLERKSEQEYSRYLAVTANLQDQRSDFYTLLNIYEMWNKHDRSEEWSAENFLNSETLIEAANIKEELLDIAGTNGMSKEDKPGFDLMERVEKTLINSFKFNILVQQRNRYFKNPRTGQKDIRLHKSSVLINAKPRFAVAFEIIEISEIDSPPKLSAKFLHSLDEKTMQKYFFELLRTERDNDRKDRRKREQYKNRRFKNHGKFGGRRGKRRR